MTMLDDRVRKSLFELPEAERAALADDLLASLDQTGESPAEVEAAWSDEIRSRIDDLIDGRVAAIPSETARAQRAEARRLAALS